MPIDQIANYAEVFGGAAVIVSLIYLAFQVRANTREQRLRREVEAHQLSSSLSDLLTNEGRIPEVMIQGLYDYDGLSGADIFRFNNAMMKAVRAMDLMFRMKRAGEVSEDDYQGIERMVHTVLSTPGGRIWWDHTGMRTFFASATQSRVDDLLAEGKAKGYGTVPDMREGSGVSNAD